MPRILSRFLDHLDLTFKKTLHAAEQDRPDVAAAGLPRVRPCA
jgi:hypothetical protein